MPSQMCPALDHVALLVSQAWSCFQESRWSEHLASAAGVKVPWVFPTRSQCVRKGGGSLNGEVATVSPGVRQTVSVNLWSEGQLYQVQWLPKLKAMGLNQGMVPMVGVRGACVPGLLA